MTDTLGQFEQLVLTAILVLGEDAYGVPIHAEVEKLSPSGKVARGAVYATLDRLQEKHLITSWLSEPVRQRGGRPRRYYRLEKAATKALKESAKASRRWLDVIAKNLGGPAWTASK